MSQHRRHTGHNEIRAQAANGPVTGLTTEWNVIETQKLLSTYLGAMPEAAREQRWLPGHINPDGVISNGRRGPEATTTTTFNILNDYVKAALDKAHPGAYVQAQFDPNLSDAAWQHKQAAALTENMQRLIGFADPAKYQLTPDELRDARQGQATDAVRQKISAAHDNPDTVLGQLARGEEVDGRFGPKSKEAWDAYIHNPQTAKFAAELGKNTALAAPPVPAVGRPITAGQNPALSANAKDLSHITNTVLLDNHNGTFYVVVPPNIDPQQYYDRFRQILDQSGGHDMGTGPKQKVDALWNGKKAGVGGSGFFIGEQVLNQPGVMDALAGRQADFAAIAQGRPFEQPTVSSGAPKAQDGKARVSFQASI